MQRNYYKKSYLATWLSNVNLLNEKINESNDVIREEGARVAQLQLQLDELNTNSISPLALTIKLLRAKKAVEKTPLGINKLKQNLAALRVQLDNYKNQKNTLNEDLFNTY